jgi:polysaccharide biosynthesis transport protein
MEGTHETSVSDLRDYFRVLRRRKWLIALAAVAVGGTTVAAAKLQTPVYRATAGVLLQQTGTDALFNSNTGQPADPTRAAQTEVQVILSRPVQDAVRAKLGVVAQVKAAVVGQTDVVDISADNTDPKAAATIANAYANAYIDFRRTQNVDGLLAAASQIQARVTDLQHQIDGLNGQITAGDLKAQATVGPQVDSLVQQQGAFKQQLAQLQVQAALKTGGAQLVGPAIAPGSPFKPRPKRSAAVGLVVGLLLGIGVAFLVEYLDDSLKSKEDLDRATHGTPNLGLIPRLGSWKARDQAFVVSLDDPQSPVAEAYRSLRTAIHFIGLDQPLQTVLVTSPSAAEGKTTTLANLGAALAQAGQRVVLSCCDLRRPRIHQFFGLDNTVGLTSVLLGELPISAALQPVPGVENLWVLASGPLPPNPSELLSSGRTAEVIASLQGHADVVLIDSPPVLPVTDAVVLSTRVDAVLLVATVGATTGKALRRALEMLNQVGAPVIGTVLNGATGEGSYGYGYQYYRYEQGTPSRKVGRRARNASQRESDVDLGASSNALTGLNGEEPAPAHRAH